MKPLQSTNSNNKTKQSISGSSNTQNNLRSTRTLSTANDVFNSSIEMEDNDDNYVTPKHKKNSKRNLSVTRYTRIKKNQTNVHDGKLIFPFRHKLRTYQH